MKEKLKATGRSPYRTSANERIKLPREFIQRWQLAVGEDYVWMYMLADGDLLVSINDYTVAQKP